jgi:hypothetical protein
MGRTDLANLAQRIANIDTNTIGMIADSQLSTQEIG